MSPNLKMSMDIIVEGEKKNTLIFNQNYLPAYPAVSLGSDCIAANATVAYRDAGLVKQASPWDFCLSYNLMTELVDLKDGSGGLVPKLGRIEVYDHDVEQKREMTKTVLVSYLGQQHYHVHTEWGYTEQGYIEKMEKAYWDLRQDMKKKRVVFWSVPYGVTENYIKDVIYWIRENTDWYPVLICSSKWQYLVDREYIPAFTYEGGTWYSRGEGHAISEGLIVMIQRILACAHNTIQRQLYGR